MPPSIRAERIQKILAAGGVASRRAAERFISAVRVRVNGKVVTELGAKADPSIDRIELDGRRIVAEAHVYVALHKPRGVVATMHDPEGRATVRELLSQVGARVYPVGRLDFATSGILLATNDGEFADGLLHPKRSVPKTYVVKVNGKMTADDMDAWRNGIRLEDGVTSPAEAKTLRIEGDKTWFELTIREGRNQQIRRMGEATGFPVMRLARIAFASITAEGLRPGQWRHLSRDELVQLKRTYGVPKRVTAAPVRAEPTKAKTDKRVRVAAFGSSFVSPQPGGQARKPARSASASSQSNSARGSSAIRGRVDESAPRPRRTRQPLPVDRAPRHADAPRTRARSVNESPRNANAARPDHKRDQNRDRTSEKKAGSAPASGRRRERT